MDLYLIEGFSNGLVVKNPPVSAGDSGGLPGSGRYPGEVWGTPLQYSFFFFSFPTPVFLSGEIRGQRSLAGYNPWGHKESEMTEQLSMNSHNSLNEFTEFISINRLKSICRKMFKYTLTEPTLFNTCFSSWNRNGTMSGSEGEIKLRYIRKCISWQNQDVKEYWCVRWTKAN